MATIGPSITLQSVGPSGNPDIAYSNFFVVGQSPWGKDGTWQICTSFNDFLRLYGGKTRLASVASGQTADTYTTETNADVVQCYEAVKGYYNEKGANSPGVLYFCRVCDSTGGPTAASRTFADSAGSNNTTITSAWKGLHGGATQVYIINPSPRKGVFTLQTGTVAVTSGMTAVTGSGTTFVTGGAWNGYGIKIGTEYYTISSVTNTTSLTLAEAASSTHTTSAFSVGNNTTAAYINAYNPANGVREEWDLEPTTQSAANISKLSELITVSLPAGFQLPRTTAPGSSGWVKLNGGSAATADAYGASDADYVGTTTAAGAKTGLEVFEDQKLGGGFVAIPGKYSATVRNAINTHCSTYYRMGLLSGQSGLNVTTAQTEFALSGNHVAGIVPQVWVSDDSSSSNANLLIDPTGHWAGLHARMDRDYGAMHKSAAGIDHGLLSVLDVERQSNGMEIYDDSASNNLADVYVNTIRIKRNGRVVWGMRTLATDERYRQIPMARVVQNVYVSVFFLMEKYTFEPIDSFGRLFAKIKGDVDSYLADLWRRGALYGTKPGKEPKVTDAFFSVCDLGNNNNVNLGKGIVTCDVSFAPTPNVENGRVNLRVSAPGFGASAAGGASI